MSESFEILFWLAVFVFFALRGAAQKRSRTSRPSPQEDGGSAGGGERRGVFADLMRQIEVQMETQRREAEARQRGQAGAPGIGSRSEVADAPEGAPAGPRGLTPAEARRRRVETVEARAHPADRRSAATARAPGRPPTEPGTGASPWRRPAAEVEERDPEHRHLPAEAAPDRTSAVPGRRVHAPGTVTVGRSPETASALRRSSATTPIDAAASAEDVRVERVASRKGAGALDRLDRYSPLRRAILLSEVLDAPPGLTGRTPLDRRLDEIG